MKIRKMITAFSFVIVMMFGIFGCADIQYVRRVFPNQSIMDKFVVTLDKAELGEEYTNVRNNVYGDMVEFRNYVSDWVKSFEESYGDIYETLKSGITSQVIENNNELSLIIEFDNWYCFGMFYGYAEEDNVEYTKAMEDRGPFIKNILSQDYETEDLNLFLYKYSMVRDDGIMGDLDDFILEEIGVDYYTKYKNLTGYDLDDISVGQIFAYPDDRIYSNADDRVVVEGETYLSWDLSGKDDGYQMTIYKLAPRTYIWYICGLLISAVVVMVITLVIAKKHKNEVKVIITKKDCENKDE